MFPSWSWTGWTGVSAETMGANWPLFRISGDFTSLAQNAHLGPNSPSTSSRSIELELSRSFLDTVTSIHFDVPVVTIQDLFIDSSMPEAPTWDPEDPTWDPEFSLRVGKRLKYWPRIGRKELYTNVVQGLWSLLLLGLFNDDRGREGLILVVEWKNEASAERVDTLLIDDVELVQSRKLETRRVKLV